MQYRKEKIYAPIKGRVHKYLKEKKIRQENFFSDLQISDSSFKGSSSKSEFGGEILTKIVLRYPSLSAHWLLTGEGDMEYSPKNGYMTSIREKNNVVNNAHNAIIQSDINAVGDKSREEEDMNINWYISQLQSQLKDREEDLKARNEQIAKLQDMLMKAQDTIHTLSTANIPNKS